MTSKQESLYEGALEHIRLRTGGIARPTIVISDYEQGLMNAARTAFPGVRNQGCFFHYSQVRCRLVKARRSFVRMTRHDGNKFD